MKTTLVINPKGGAGKTTVATNLASYFASERIPCTLMDYDPQGSSLNWLRLRAPHAPRIHAANGAPTKYGNLRGFENYVPPETRQLVIDAPAGASGLLLHELLDKAHCIVIPVVPSPIDLHASSAFIKSLLMLGKLRERNVRIAVVANKVRRSMPAYQPLDWFLNSHDLKLLARLIDSDVYFRAAESGVGIFEMDENLSVSERKQFTPIAHWVEDRQAPVRSEGMVFDLARARSVTV
jgi:chromosome partitioning protein